MTQTEMIPLERLPELLEKVAKVNKQAAKIGVPAFVLTETGKREERVKKTTLDAAGKEIKHYATFTEVALEGAIPKLPGGWELVGVVSFEEALPIIRTVPEKTVPANQRNRGPVCDHCGYERKRSETFIVQAEAGEVKQVGRQCLADFLGLSAYAPEALLAVVAFLREWSEEGEEGSEWGEEGGGHVQARYLVTEIVEIAGACIAAYGWCSKGRADAAEIAGARGVVPTSEHVWNYLNPPKPGYRTAAFDKFVAEIREKRTPELRAEVEKAIEWARAQRGAANDYLNNLGTIANLQDIAGRNVALTCSLIASYQREQATLRELERKAKSAAYVGTVGKREVFKVKYLGCRAFEGDYGVHYRAEFETPEGYTLVWWASNAPEDFPVEGGLKKGETYEVAASVKKHEEWKGIKQTTVTRVAPPPAPKKKPRKEKVA